MGKQTKIIPIAPTQGEHQEGQSILGSLLNTLSDIDQELEQHLNSNQTKITTE